MVIERVKATDLESWMWSGHQEKERRQSPHPASRVRYPGPRTVEN